MRAYHEERRRTEQACSDESGNVREMPVKAENIKDIKMAKNGTIESFACVGCGRKYHNPLYQSDWKKFDEGCELRMSCERIEIRCEKCKKALIVVTP